MKAMMAHRNQIRFILVVILVFFTLFSLIPPSNVQAQAETATRRYENPMMGVAFDIPTNWEVVEAEERLVVGTSATLAAYENNTPPQGLLFSVVMGTFGRLPIQNINQLPDQLKILIPANVVAPEPTAVTYGNVTGYDATYTIEDSGIKTRVAILYVPGGRVAVVRGLAATAIWDNEAGTQFENIIATLQFSQPANVDPYANIIANDGGVFWHYQTGQPSDGKALQLGGIVYDSFGVMYIAAGARGFLALDQNDGEFMNFLGPLRDDDNLVDVTISVDQRLYFANASSGDNERIMVIDRVGNYIRSWGSAGEEVGQFAPNMPQTITITQSGDIWTVSEGHTVSPEKRLYRFDSFGNFLGMIDLETINPDLNNIYIDYNWETAGLVVIGEQGGINLLDENGAPLVTRINEDLLNAAKPFDVTVAAGSVLVIPTENEGFLAFTIFGEILDRFGISYNASRGDAFQPGEYYHPRGIAVGRDSMVYFAETHPDTQFSQIQAFRFSGEGPLPLAQNSPTTIVLQTNGVGLYSGGPIAAGTSVSGTITNQNPQFDYTISLQAGDRVKITLRDISSEQKLDTFITLLNATGNTVATNDDVAPPIPDGLKGTDSVLTYVVGTSGDYTIRVGRFGGLGEYELSVELE